MLKILVNAYACSPHTGSEPGMAWNWCCSLAKYCEIFIITEGEFQEHIEKELKVLPQAKNMHFYYNRLSPKIREMCWNQGDWRFYRHYKKWQYKTYELALEICEKENIEILHQLNMIGFREPGYLWKIDNIPFVWGPIGGLKQFPEAYFNDAKLKIKLFLRLKNFISTLQLKYDQRIHKALNRADLLISSIPDSHNALKIHKGLESIIIPETGCIPIKSQFNIKLKDQKFVVLWVGKFDFRKQLPLALKAIAETQNKNIYLHIYGQGSKEQELELKKLVSNLEIEKQIVWQGNQPNYKVQEAMQNAQLFFFTSVSEDTSTVVLEAITNYLPVLCFDTCGMGEVIDDEVGRKIPLSTPYKSIVHFSEQLNFLYNKPNILNSLSQNCEIRQKELSWNQKAKTMLAHYNNLKSQNDYKS
ncbi:glycosyltransferase [Maribacter aquivivus]|uniref:glycosyltransferase n=1 Tax=Maribacter aquivivus TaxID=228958 RepID=UPI002494BE8A|nr:glycosyltransferase [Maribacter aquivivus]